MEEQPSWSPCNIMFKRLFARSVFYPSLLYGLVMERIGLKDWYNRIDHTVILGALPFRSTADQLVNKENVKGVVTMNEEYETKQFCPSKEEWAQMGVTQLRLSVVDMLACPTQQQLKQAVDFIMKHQKQGGSVYVHCKAGRSRSATVVACYLMKLHGWTPEDAIETVRLRRPSILVKSLQMSAIQKYFEQIINR